MPSVKLSITVKAALEAKYPAAARARIDTALKKWIAADAARGILTTHVALDDAAAMGQLGVAAIKGRATALRCKRAIDALCRKLAPEYVVIVGGDEIVPHFRVANPSQSPDGDTDTEVTTDNPYACSTPYRAKDRKSYLVPDRVLGRVTDVDGDADPALIVGQLDRAAAWKPRPRSFYASAYSVCCDAWKPSGADCMRNLGLPTSELMISPPTVDATATARTRLARPLHLIKCHGAELDARFFGQRGNSYPEVLASATVQARVTAGTLVGAMCCYGAQVHSPADPASTTPGALPLAAAYLKQGAVAMMGATKIAWVGPEVMMCADWIVAGYLKSALGGASVGRALLESKQEYMRFLGAQGQPPDSADEKTLIEFVLLGDPSLHPVATAAAPAGKKVAAPSAVALAERTLRRAVRAQLATQIRRVLPQRQAAPAPAAAQARKVFRQAAGALSKADAAFGLNPARAQASRLVSGAPQPAAAAGPGGPLAAALAGGRRESIEYTWSARKTVQGLVQLRLLKVETDEQGTVLRTRILHSA